MSTTDDDRRDLPAHAYREQQQGKHALRDKPLPRFSGDLEFSPDRVLHTRRGQGPVTAGAKGSAPTTPAPVVTSNGTSVFYTFDLRPEARDH